MTSPAPAPHQAPLPRDLTARVFRALFADLDLRTIGSTHIAVPKGTAWFAAGNLSDLARRVAAARHPDRDCNFNGVTPDKQGDTSDRCDNQPGPRRSGAVGGG